MPTDLHALHAHLLDRLDKTANMRAETNDEALARGTMLSGLAAALTAVRAELDRQPAAERPIVTVCAEHGDVLADTWEDDDGDLLVRVEPCPLCAREAHDRGVKHATGRAP